MNRAWLAGLILPMACGGSKAAARDSPDPCPRDGVVPADFRDVERDAEGVSYASFGAYPDRSADFSRATGVLSLLSRVWSSGQASCPDLPAEVTTTIDGAISTLGTTLPASDQKGSAYAANDIHLQMGALFSYFAPETPVEVVGMDALFLRIGLDAWFGDWAAYHQELVALEADWAVLEPHATAKVPTCHRVAGTATVVEDLTATLANLRSYEASGDVDGAQVESDSGLLQVDILELLYDCVPDGTTPEQGLGAPCGDTTDCDSGQVCNLEAGGVCAPDPATTNVGMSCTTTVDCGSDPRDACNSEVGDGFPGGYCTMEPCDDAHVCSSGATCVAMPFETPACLQSCLDDAECRTSDGYVCQLFPTTPPIGFGPSERACAFACTEDAGCTPPLTCDVASGKCTP